MAELRKRKWNSQCVPPCGKGNLHKVAAPYSFIYIFQLYKEDWGILAYVGLSGRSSLQYQADSADLQNTVNSVNYEPIDFDTGLTQGSVDTVSEFVEGKVDNYYTETTITNNSDSAEEVPIQNIEERNIMVDSHDELDLWEAEQIPHTLISLVEGQILEEFMLEEIEFQGIDKCKIVELPDEQEINECAVSALVEYADLLVRFIEEQEIEECIEEEICDRSLPKLYIAKESVHEDKIMLEPPETNAVAINEMPREVKLEMSIEQSESKLVQDVNLVSDVPTPSHAVPNRNILGKSMPKLHTRWKKILGSKLVRRINPLDLSKEKFLQCAAPS